MNETHWRECETCFKSHQQDAMRRCPNGCGAWLHEDCECTNEDCLQSEAERRWEQSLGDAFDGGFAENY